MIKKSPIVTSITLLSLFLGSIFVYAAEPDRAALQNRIKALENTQKILQEDFARSRLDLNDLLNRLTDVETRTKKEGSASQQQVAALTDALNKEREAREAQANAFQKQLEDLKNLVSALSAALDKDRADRLADQMATKKALDGLKADIAKLQSDLTAEKAGRSKDKRTLLYSAGGLALLFGITR